MTVDTRLMTAEELLRMPDRGIKYELVRGELKTMSPAGERHGRISLRLAAHLLEYVEARALGVVYGADTGFLLSQNPDTVRAPDAAFMRRERVIYRQDYIVGSPDLAVEVMSPNDRRSEVEEKIAEYLGSGCLLAIVIDPRKGTASLHTKTNLRRLGIDDALDGGDVVPGWILPLRELFAQAGQARNPTVAAGS